MSGGEKPKDESTTTTAGNDLRELRMLPTHEALPYAEHIANELIALGYTHSGSVLTVAAALMWHYLKGGMVHNRPMAELTQLVEGIAKEVCDHALETALRYGYKVAADTDTDKEVS